MAGDAAMTGFAETITKQIEEIKNSEKKLQKSESKELLVVQKQDLEEKVNALDGEIKILSKRKQSAEFKFTQLQHNYQEIEQKFSVETQKNKELIN